MINPNLMYRSESIILTNRDTYLNSVPVVYNSKYEPCLYKLSARNKIERNIICAPGA
jgi:hypothetical protein